MKVPVWLDHLRTDRRGIPVPWINRYGDHNDPACWRIDHCQAAGGLALFADDYGDTPDFLHQSIQRQRVATAYGLCQVCARPVPWSRRFLVVSAISTEVVRLPVIGERVVLTEPWLDHRCAQFALQKCPGLIRRHTADDLHLVPVTSKLDCRLWMSSGWVEGPLEEESKRLMPYMWAKVALVRWNIQTRT